MKISLRGVYSDIKNTISPQTEDAAFEAKELLQAVFGVSRQDILLGRETEVESKQLDRLCELARRRASGEGGRISEMWWWVPRGCDTL